MVLCDTVGWPTKTSGRSNSCSTSRRCVGVRFRLRPPALRLEAALSGASTRVWNSIWCQPRSPTQMLQARSRTLVPSADQRFPTKGSQQVDAHLYVGRLASRHRLIPLSPVWPVTSHHHNHWGLHVEAVSGT